MRGAACESPHLFLHAIPPSAGAHQPERELTAAGKLLRCVELDSKKKKKERKKKERKVQCSVMMLCSPCSCRTLGAKYLFWSFPAQAF